MADSVLSLFVELFDLEMESEGLVNVPKSLYRDSASRIRELLSADFNGNDVLAKKMAVKESEMIYQLSARLFEMRISKVRSHSSGKVDEGVLTAEEKFALEPLSQSQRRLERVKRAIRSGQLSFLEHVSNRVARKYVLVRFERSSPQLVGVDLERYGPFQPGDLAVLPLENAKPMIKQGSVKDVRLDYEPLLE
ncbi:MAG: hypothetical protein HY619_02355 [Thaumarchaeota archaeon]|nr:hypothetical protein [Nitrososphaerota archaeon]